MPFSGFEKGIGLLGYVGERGKREVKGSARSLKDEEVEGVKGFVCLLAESKCLGGLVP